MVERRGGHWGPSVRPRQAPTTGPTANNPDVRRPFIAGRAFARIAPAWWLAGIVSASFVSLAVGGRAVSHPSVFVDELVYSGAAERLAEGLGPAVPGGGYGFGVLYPLSIAPLYALFEHVPDAYAAVKVLNAAFFSLAAVPAYLLARRGCGPGLALGVALLTVLLPARAYTFFVLTESLAFAVFLFAALAVVRALERPTVTRQLVMLGAAALAVETRRQNLVVVAAIPLSILLASWLQERDLRRTWRAAARYSVTWAAFLVATLLLVAVPLAQGDGAGARLGPYEVLLHGYELGAVTAWTRNHVAVLGLTLGVLPLLALPFGLSASFGRGAPAPRRALGVVTAVLVALVVVQVGVFSSGDFGLNRVHERYLFYVAPLALAMLAVWIQQGLPRPRTAVWAAAAAVIALPLLLPEHGIRDGGIDTPTLPALGYGASGGGLYGSFHVVAIVWSAFLALWILAVRPRQAAALLAVVAVALAIVDVRFNRWVVDEARAIELTATAGRPGLPRDWIDRAVGKEAEVVAVSVAPAPTCPTARVDRIRASTSFQQAVFFNTGIVRVVSVGPPPDVGLPVTRARLTRSGLVASGTAPASARLVVANARLPLRGRRIRHDPAGRLTLWAVDGPLQLEGVRDDASARGLVCTAGRTA
ncbi:MAG TPA: hypothetical protein VH572_00365 [Gaiella sp.]